MIDLIPYVNAELASLQIGAHPLTFLEKGKNPVRCDNKKFKGSVVVYLNESNGKITNFSIYSPKHGGVKSRTVKIRDILNRGYEPAAISDQEIESLRVESERRKTAKKQAIERACRQAVDSYRRAVESGNSGYFLRKQVKPAPGIKFDGKTAIIPVCKFKPHSNELKVVAIQRIDENGQKLFNKNAEISGGFFPIGNRLNPQHIYFSEGVATGLSIHQSFDNPNILVVACFDSGNLKKVVAEFASHYPMIYSRHGFVLCSDNDQWIDNPRARFAGFKAIDGIIDQFPKCLISYADFDKSLANLYVKHGVANPTDFNDYMILNGSPAVQWAVHRQAMTASEFRQLYDFKSNSLVDDDAQRELLARISADYKNRQFARFASNALKCRIFINDFDEILKRVSKLRGEIRNNIESTNYPVARVDKQLQFVTRDDLLPQNNNDFARCEFRNHDAEKVKFSSSEFFSQIYDFKNNSLCDVEKQSRLREFKLRTPIKRAVIKICAPILPILQVDRAEREAAKQATADAVRAAKIAIDDRVKITCEESDAATSAELNHLPKSKVKSIQSSRRAQIRASGNLAKKAIENARHPAAKYRIVDVGIDSEANAIAAYFAPFKDVEIGMATGKFTQITSKYVDIPLLPDGATKLLYCGMGAGKTQNFIKQSVELIEQIYLTENRVANILVLSPRKALVNKLVFDLNRAVDAWKTENNISDIEIPRFYSYETLKKGGVDGQKIQVNLIVSTVHSAKFFDTENFDLVIADEFHQSRNCFIQQMENKVENYESLNSTIRTARRFIATGADLTQFDIDFIENLRGQSHVHYQLPVNQQKHLALYQNKKQLVKSAWEFIKAGQSLIVACNSKAFIKAVAKLLDKLGISNLCIFDEVTGEPNASRFLDDPNGEIDKYQVVLYSPVITSGISFDALPTRTDRKVFGYFTSHIGTASDAWQMLGRFRGNGTEYHVCLDAPIKDAGILAQERTDVQLKRFIERVARNAAKLGELVDIPQVKRLLNQKVGQSVEYTDFDIDNFSLQDQEIAAQRAYFSEFVTQMLAQKITFSIVGQTEHDAELQKLLNDAVDAVKIEDIQRVVKCNSTPINEKRREEIKNKSRVTQAESAEAKHFDYRAFLATPELSERDVEFMTKRGKSKIYAIERANAELLPIHLKQAHDELASSPISLVRFGLNHGEFIKRLLAVVGLAQFKDGQIQLSEKWGEWGGKINISTPSVQRFFAWAWENRNWINNLQIADLRTITEGFSDNLTWLNSALAAIGIKLQCYEKIAVGTARVRKYCVDLDNLDYINSILARRFNKIHAEKLESPTMEMG